jgi:DNA (cytosine-5)-methyltransferase 1
MGFETRTRKFRIAVSDTQAYRQFGNAVCPHVVRAIGSEILQVILARKARISR